MTTKRTKKPRTLPKRIVSEHYGLELHEGDSINLRLPPMSELQRDAEWGKAHGWEFVYWPDGTKTIEFPNGRVRLPGSGG